MECPFHDPLGHPGGKSISEIRETPRFVLAVSNAPFQLATIVGRNNSVLGDDDPSAPASSEETHVVVGGDFAVLETQMLLQRRSAPALRTRREESET